MDSNTTLTIATSVIAVSAGMLTWLAFDIGTIAVKRYRENFSARAGLRVRELFLFIDPAKIFLANIAVMALGAMLAWLATGSALSAIPVFFALALLPRVLFTWMRRRRLRTFENQLPDALTMLSAGLRAGIGINAAISQLVAETHAPLAQEFALLMREQRLGVTLEQSLNHLSQRMPTQSTILVVSAMRIAHETGGGLAETLERTAHTIRTRLQLEGKIGALTAQGKLQAWVVGALPLVLMLVLNKMEPEAMSLLWHSQMGWATLAVVAFFESMGIYVIRRIISINV